VEGFEDGCLQVVGEEGVFVGGLVAADEGVEAFLFAEHPVEEGEGAGGDLDAAGGVDGFVEGELDAFD